MIGLIYSSFSLSRAILQAPIGRLSDSYSKKKIIIVGLAGYTVTSVLYTFVTSPETLILVRMLHGVGSAMVMPVAMAYAIELTGVPEHRPVLRFRCRPPYRRLHLRELLHGLGV
jgi:MFS family permease